MCAVTANLGTWAPAFKDMARAPATRMRLAPRIRQAFAALCSQCLFTQLAASNASRSQRRLHSSVDCWRLANDRCARSAGATAFCSLTAKCNQLALAAERAGSRRLQLSLVHSL